VLFAVDSIPAVLGISHNPFVVYTSNIAAVLGLRSLYFALAALLDRFRYLHYGLGAMLAFVAIKMLASRWLEIPITLSLAIMGVILSVCAIISWLVGERTVDSEQWTVNGSDGEANRSPLPDLFEWPSAVRQLAELGKAGVRG
jgi:tellurite resistance protein TerC